MLLNNYPKFFSEFLLVCVLIATLMVSIKRKGKYPELKLIPVYIGYLLAIFIPGVLVEHIPLSISYYRYAFWGLSYLDHTFTLVELLIFTYIFIKILNSVLLKKILLVLVSIYLIYFTYETILDKFFPIYISENTQARAYTIEALILTVPCISFLSQLFNKKTNESLKNNPFFWIITGLFLFTTCTLPFSIFENYLRNEYLIIMNDLYSIFHIFYIIFCLMIIRAFKCTPQETSQEFNMQKS